MTMKWFIILAGLLSSFSAAQAEQAPSQNWMSGIKNMMPAMPDISVPALPAMPSLSLPAMPDFSMPDFARMSDGLMAEFNAFTQQVADTLPMLEEMGYEVSTFRVQWGLPPKAKLRLRSKVGTNPDKVAAIAAKATGGTLMTALISSAATAKRIQSSMKLGTAILDVDFALPPRVKMSFLSGKPDRKDAVERDVEDLDLACGQALGN
jgi:hypothetical protein